MGITRTPINSCAVRAFRQWAAFALLNQTGRQRTRQTNLNMEQDFSSRCWCAVNLGVAGAAGAAGTCGYWAALLLLSLSIVGLRGGRTGGRYP